MNERGFMTIFALCMILVIALAVSGIQRAEMNHNYETSDLSTEFDLQNVADGGIYEAAELVRSGQKELPTNNNATAPARRKKQVQLLTRTIEINDRKIKLTVWGERLKIQGYTPTYSSESSRGYPVTETGTFKYGYILFSLAETTGDRTGEKIYRRAFAYVIDGQGVNDRNKPVNEDVDPKDKDVVHFMELPSVTYRKK